MAPAIIVTEAGGVITRRSGGPALEPDSDGYYSAIASNGLAHDRLIDLLAD